MAINPAQACAATTIPREVCVAKKGSSGSSAFDSLLKSLERTEGGSTPTQQQAAAELLRIEMMYNSLSLSSDPVESPLSGSKAIETWLTGLVGNHGAPTTGPARWTMAPLPAVSGELPAAASPGPKNDVELISETASQYIGTPYRFGGEGAAGIDCSSFVQQVFREHQIDLPRTAREQINMGNEVAEGDLRKGDLVFFQTYASYPSHVGIYLGDGKMIHASSGKGEVTISDIDSEYYGPRYLGAKRVV